MNIMSFDFNFLNIFSWNRLDVLIVILSVVGIALEEVRSGIIPINPTIIRTMRVLRIARGSKQGGMGEKAAMRKKEEENRVKKEWNLLEANLI